MKGLYLNHEHINHINFEWKDIILSIQNATAALEKNDFSQPIKPYLKYGNLTNRIIAMPAYVGGKTDTAGIKWIAGFPDNIKRNEPRANSVTILNESQSGKPYCIINTSQISAIRTAAVSGAVIQNSIDKNKSYKVGIIGFGPIGKTHLDMLENLFSDNITSYHIYDKKEETMMNIDNKKVHVHSDWQSVFEESDIFITCTVSTDRYINLTPKAEGIYLNVSLRDFELSCMEKVSIIGVDNWEEICRQNTDIEQMFLAGQLTKEDVLEIDQILLDSDFKNKIKSKSFMFNPMGMAIYDMSVAKCFYQAALEQNIGVDL